MIRPVDMQMILPQTNNVSTQQHNANQHAVLQSAQGSAELAKEVRQQSETVISKDGSELLEYRYDAKEKGSNSYDGSRRQKRKRKEESTSEEKKKQPGESWINFDIKI